jgi:uncharacterized protein
MVDLLLVLTLGFLGSFGHCAGMCSPLTVAFSLSQQDAQAATKWQALQFHGLLNLGRILSYALVGAGIGGLGSVLVAGGQLAGIDSDVRRAIAIATGLLMIAFGIHHIQPGLLPKLRLMQLPLLQWVLRGIGHDRLSKTMIALSLRSRWWTPALLGLLWGLIPCGFLYAAQIKAAETSSVWGGALTMLAFGMGTMPVMVGLGVSAASLSRDRRSQLYRLGGWVTVTIGILLLLRTSDMVDFTGHAALFCLMLALIARPISRLWAFPLRYRRAFGVGAFMLSGIHMLHMLDHTFNWHLRSLQFMLPLYQVGIWAGIIGLVLLAPAALTSFNWMEKALGQHWRQLHLLSVPALLACTGHTVLAGSRYLGSLQWSLTHCLLSCGLVSLTLGVLLLRSPWAWAVLSLRKFYAPSPPHRSN